MSVMQMNGKVRAQDAASLPNMRSDALLQVQNLKMHFPIRRGFLRRVVGHVKAVDGVNLFIRPGETLGLVGESGCGKTTTGRCIIRAYQPTSGRILYRNDDNSVADLAPLNGQELKPYHREIRMIFQDPYSSLNPRMTVLEIIGEPFVTRNLIKNRGELEDRVAALLRSVRLDPSLMQRYPHAFSGGQRQRVAIARALALNPDFVVADEPISALDVSVQAQILSLLKELQNERHLTYLFITHNLSVVEYISNRVAVMYVGQIVELGQTETIFHEPKHPYTEALLSAVPVVKTDKSGRRRERIVLEGDVADPANVPSGCSFHPRCAYAQAICSAEKPELINIARSEQNPHYVRCHFANELNLRGVKQLFAHSV